MGHCEKLRLSPQSTREPWQILSKRRGGQPVLSADPCGYHEEGAWSGDQEEAEWGSG